MVEPVLGLAVVVGVGVLGLFAPGLPGITASTELEANRAVTLAANNKKVAFTRKCLLFILTFFCSMFII